MQELIELTDIVTRQKVSQIEIITEEAKLSNQSKLLLDGIRNGKIRSDKEAMQLLYGGENKEAYKKIKSRLKERLSNTLFFIDVNKHIKGEGPKKRFRAYKKFSMIMILAYEEKRELSRNMAIKLLRQAERLSIFDLVILLCNHLQEYYLVWAPNSEKAEYYYNKYKKLITLQIQERQATNLWAKLVNLLMTDKANKAEVNFADLKTELQKIRIISKTNRQYTFNYRMYSSFIFFHWLNENYREQKQISAEALEYLQPYAHSNPVALVIMTTYKAIAELNLGEYETSEHTLTGCLEKYKMTPGKLHWLNIFNYLFLIKMIKKEYAEGAKILSQVISIWGFKKLDLKWLQPWLVKEAFINILVKVGKISESELQGVTLRPFRVHKFMNEVPFFAKNKRGTNIAILIAQFIYLLAVDKTNKLYERLDGLNQYCHRYLRNDYTYRSNCFIKMLMKIPALNFHPVRVRSHTEVYWKKLKKAPLQISEQSYEVEIIPYEDLWQIVLEILDNRKD